MAAPSGKMVGVSDDSSSEDDADLEKLKEAVWATQCVKTTDGESNGKKSQRIIVSKHEHDGNELQVTPEFRLHVAKKLGQLLDSSISEMPAETVGKSWTESGKCDDEGFRLFGTSIPGQEVDDTPPPVRRRPIPSSSDSDSEMESRLREAAVSITDLLPPSSLPSALSSSFREAQGNMGKMKGEKTQERGEGVETPVGKKRKRRKKKKPPQGDNEDVAGTLGKIQEEETLLRKKKKKRKCHSEESGGQVGRLDSAVPAASNAQSNSEPGHPEEERVSLKVKRKKKREAAGENGEQGLD